MAKSRQHRPIVLDFRRSATRMCVSCWEEAGEPQIWNESVERAVNLIGELYEINAVGAPLHVEIDDWNVDHETIEPWCAWSDDDPQVQAAGFAVASKLAAVLNTMSLAERYSALAAYDGFWTPSQAARDRLRSTDA